MHRLREIDGERDCITRRNEHENVSHVVIVGPAVVEAVLYYKPSGLFKREFQAIENTINILQTGVPLFVSMLKFLELFVPWNLHLSTVVVL